MNTTLTLLLIAAGLLPGLEPRYIAPILASKVGVYMSLTITAAEVVTLSAILTLAVGWATRIVERCSARLGLLGRLYWRVRSRAEKIRTKLGVYGLLGLAAFVAIPLPFTGIYTGALAALLAGMRKSETFIGLVVGGLTSVLVTLFSARLAWELL